MKNAKNVLDASFTTAACFLFALVVSKFMDALFYTFDPTKSKVQLALEATFEFAVIGAVLYLSRKFISGIKIFKDRPEDIASLPILVFIFMFFQVNLQKKVKFIMGESS
jgi:hypothetical protein